MPVPIITLITDFGNKNHYVGAMKGVIKSINPNVCIIDITHEIPPFDILQASYVLQTIIDPFPSATIHVVVVDPEVGSSRRPIIAVGDKHYYVMPDNGIITGIHRMDNVHEVRAVEGSHYMLPRICETFHGRDIFAPIAAWLSKSMDSERFGDVIHDYKLLELPKSTITGDRTMRFHVLFSDHFGNIITNLDRNLFEELREQFPGGKITIRIGQTLIEGIKTHYHQVPNPGDALALFGSMDLLEIAVREGSAEQFIGAKRGDPVIMQFGE